MQPSSLIGHCRELLDEILDHPARPADQAISRFFRDRRYLGSRDRGFISDTVYGVLRAIPRQLVLLGDVLRRPRMSSTALDARLTSIQIGKIGERGSSAEGSILLAAYLLRGGSIDKTAIFEGTRLTARLIESIEQSVRTEEERIALLDEPAQSAVRYSLPEWFVMKVLVQMGESEGRDLLTLLNQQAPITIRTNRLIATREALQKHLAEQSIPSAAGEHSPDALLLSRRMNANAIPEFKQGWFELQDEGSQMLSIILDPHPNWRVFDACAGAGGKSLHLAARMKGRGEITAHDVNRRRLEEIRPRLRRSGAQNVRIMEPDQYRSRREKLLGTFDGVLIDAPCSGTGVLRRNPGARLTLDEEMIERVTKLQREILDEYSGLVKPGGVLLYATCSLLREENESQAEWFLAKNSGWKIEPAAVPESMRSEEGYLHCYPHRHGTDGFFGVLLRRVE